MAEGEKFLIKKLVIHPTLAISKQYHNYRQELWYILEGEGQFYHNGVREMCGPGDVFKVKQWDWHQVRNTSFSEDLVVIEVWTGDVLSEDDIVREN